VASQQQQQQQRGVISQTPTRFDGKQNTGGGVRGMSISRRSGMVCCVYFD
jgi:hypothetical protein